MIVKRINTEAIQKAVRAEGNLSTFVLPSWMMCVIAEMKACAIYAL
jgi:hypothetical protein